MPDSFQRLPNSHPLLQDRAHFVGNAQRQVSLVNAKAQSLRRNDGARHTNRLAARQQAIRQGA